MNTTGRRRSGTRMPCGRRARWARARWFIAAVLGVCLLAGARDLPVAAHASDGQVTSPGGPPAPRPRLMDHGIGIGVLPRGPLNAITDVADVRVGHATRWEGDSVRTGVTAVLPHPGNLFREKVPAAIHVANGFGKLTGVSQVRELGTLETPILLTSTLSVPRVADALVGFMLGLPGNERVRSVNPVVGETNDGYLNDIRSRPLSVDDVRSAILDARPGPVEEGVVGAGTGTVAFGFKGGIGTASRRVPDSLGGWTVGVLAQTNFGGVLTVAGAPIGRVLGRYYLRDLLEPPSGTTAGPVSSGIGSPPHPADGSCMLVVATDAPLRARNLERLARRAILGMARTGAAGSNGSGDYVIAFSGHRGLRTGPDAEDPTGGAEELGNDQVSPLFLAAIEAAEEAILDSLFVADTVRGREGRIVEGLPLEPTLEELRRIGAIELPR